MKHITNAPSGQLGHALSMRDRAIDLARMGFRVFKLQINGKKPVVAKFYDVASSDPEVVRAMWTCPVSGDSLDNNIGVSTGNGLMVLDIDVKDGKQGLRSLRSLEKKKRVPVGGARVRTASGGIHVYLSTPVDVPNSAGHVASGVDVRGHHGYVVGAGSVIGDTTYTWIQEPTLAPSEAVHD